MIRGLERRNCRLQMRSRLMLALRSSQQSALGRPLVEAPGSAHNPVDGSYMSGAMLAKWNNLVRITLNKL